MRYKVINESVSEHFCFVATVEDTKTPSRAFPGHGRTVCECFTRTDAEKVARALNAEEVATDTEYLGAFNTPSREWLIKRLMDGGGIAPEYGIAMLDKIEQLERDLEEDRGFALLYCDESDALAAALTAAPALQKEIFKLTKEIRAGVDGA